ncbi:MAG: hypothetical protein JXB32_15275 [Deltaproteobacteria bacterium]|nr:hypothetical protein [Deltaproteobacteria bacterium]
MPARAPLRHAFPVAVAALVALQLGLALHFAPPEVLFGGRPVLQIASDAPVTQVARGVEALDDHFAGWSYDVRRSAGGPSGTAWDVRSPAWTLTAWALSRLGVPDAPAHAAFLGLAHLLAPWAVFAAVLLLGLGRWTAWTAGLLATSLWYFDAHAHWSWWSGRAGWALAAFLAPLALALVLRWAREPRRTRAVAAGAMLAVLPLVHVAALLPLLPALAAVAFARGPQPSRRRWPGALIMTGLVVAANAWWVWAALRGGGGGSLPDATGGGLSLLLADLFGFIGPDPLVSGVISNRTVFRLLVLAAAAATLVRWYREHDFRFGPFAWGVGGTLAAAYLGDYVPGLASLGTYGFLLFAATLAVPPAAATLVELVRGFDPRALPQRTVLLLAVAGVVALPAAARDVIYFFPEAVPDPRPPANSPVGQIGFIDTPHVSFRHEAPERDFAGVAGWVRAHWDGTGRIAVHGPLLAEYLLWATDAPILGGRAPRLPYVRPTFGPAGGLPTDPPPSPEELRDYLRTYAVSLVITWFHAFPPDRFGEVLVPVARLPAGHVVYRSREAPSWFAENSGLVRASTSRLEVHGVDAYRDVVLRFHWHPRLRCRPQCRLVREPVPGDPAGFLRIPTPHPSSMYIDNAY